MKKLRSILAAVALSGAALVLAGCSRSPSGEFTEQKVENIVRIVLRQENYFDLYLQEPGSTLVEEKYLQIKKMNRKIIADVPKDGMMWILLKRDQNKKIWYAEFHIRSMADVHAGTYPYRVGKSTRYDNPAIIE